MSTTKAIYRLKGRVQHYSWGGYDFIPQLLSIENSEQKPHAEYWMGAHPNLPSSIEVGDSDIRLNAFIEQNKERALGALLSKFDALPFLLKILDVRQMLSIQVHPGKQSAMAGYLRENEAGISVTASHRNYKDDNHKPELMVALGDFWLLHGFKPKALLLETLSAIPDFLFLIEEFNKGGYKSVYEKVMLMDQEEVNKILDPVIKQILPLYHNGEFVKSQESFWAARAADSFCKNGNYDRGIFSIFLFNLVHLKTGEGVFQPAQLPHAYLEGQNVEIMANSDNVLRAGLTDKHIDVGELMKHVRFEETIPDILGSYTDTKEETYFPTPVSEFELYQYRLEKSNLSLISRCAEILIALGDVSITSETESLSLTKGQAAFILADTAYSLEANDADVFRAAVPMG